MMEYWHCILGPVDSSLLSYGADFPLRQAVRETFYDVPAHRDTIVKISSGWGMTQDIVDKIQKIKSDSFMERNGIVEPKNDICATAEQRTTQLMFTPKMYLPPLANAYSDYMISKHGMCGATYEIAFNTYAHLVEGLPTEYPPCSDATDWFRRHGHEKP